jgi:hypothetical protein
MHAGPTLSLQLSGSAQCPQRLADLGSGIVASATLRLLPLGARGKAGQGRSGFRSRYGLAPLPTPRGFWGRSGLLGARSSARRGTWALDVGRPPLRHLSKTGIIAGGSGLCRSIVPAPRPFPAPNWPPEVCAAPHSARRSLRNPDIGRGVTSASKRCAPVCRLMAPMCASSFGSGKARFCWRPPTTDSVWSCIAKMSRRIGPEEALKWILKR